MEEKNLRSLKQIIHMALESEIRKMGIISNTACLSLKEEKLPL